ncbi:MAG TPA: hypothetical protein VGF48_12990 [Thermoanaerobaculia bacterium]|jgi:hypothetical protein
MIIQILLASTLILRGGDKIAIDEPPRIEKGVVIFRSAGALYSLPAMEVDEEATRLEAERAARPQDRIKKLRVSPEERQRLIAELEKNHSGVRVERPIPPLPPEPLPPAPRPAPQDEWQWRNRARAHEEAVRQAKEEVQLLEERIGKLRGEIHSFFSLGYKAHQFTYQSTQLEYALAQLPRAELEVTRAERAWAQFREDARKQGILPGWLR